MLTPPASEGLTVFQSIQGCPVDEAVSRLKDMGWSVSPVLQFDRSIMKFTAATAEMRMVVYAKDGRVVNANFGKRRTTFRFNDVPPPKTK